MKIQTKLILALSSLALILCFALYYLIQWSFDRGMAHYVNQQERQVLNEVAESLSGFYQQHGSWQGLSENPRKFHDIIRSELGRTDRSPPRRPPPGPGSKGDGVQGDGPPHHRRGHNGRDFRPSLLDAHRHTVVGRSHKKSLDVEVLYQGEIVGWLSVPRPRHSFEQMNISLRSNVLIAFGVLGCVLVFVVVFIGVPLSRHFGRPIREIALVTKSLTEGDYDINIRSRRSDEIGQLARDVEILAKTLKSNEQSRSRWVADISHELRTPLAITLGEVEAMLDGVRPINEDNIISIKNEVNHLSVLVNDLYELSNAEIGALRYNKVPVDFRQVLSQSIQRFNALFNERNFTVEVSIPKDEVWVNGDVQRLNQLFNNLFSNELKYADEAARVNVLLENDGETLIFVIEDSGPGVSREHQSKLFDYIYRVENSRNRATGGSGLGLSICRKIVEAHDGTILSAESELGGLKLILSLPIIRKP